MEELIGTRFILPQGKFIGISHVKQAAVVLLLHVSSWSISCNRAISAIKQFYERINYTSQKDRKSLEIVYVPCEKNEKKYLESINRIGFPAIPYQSSYLEMLKDLFDYKYSPSVVLIREDGSTVFIAIKRIIEEGYRCGYRRLKRLADV